MGCTSSEQKQTSEQQNDVAKIGDEERALIRQLETLGVSQQDALKFVLKQGQQQAGLIGLQDSDKALLDQTFSGAETNLRRFGQLMGQDLAGTRGLNPSDTPVSEAVLREMLPAMANLQSQKAGQSLNLGLNLAELNQDRLRMLLQGVQTGPSVSLGLANRFQADRFAKSKQTGTQTFRNQPSLMSGISQGIGVGSDLLDLGSKAGNMAKGFMTPLPTLPTS